MYVADFLETKRLIEGALARFVVSKQHLLAHRLVRKEGLLHQPPPDAASLPFWSNEDILQVNNGVTVANDSRQTNEGAILTFGCDHAQRVLHTLQQGFGIPSIGLPPDRVVELNQFVDSRNLACIDQHLRHGPTPVRANRLDFLVLLILPTRGPPGYGEAMTVQTWSNVPSRSLGMRSTLTVVTPEGRGVEPVAWPARAGDREPGLAILLHGLSGNNAVWAVRNDLRAVANQFNLVLALPDGARSFWLNQAVGLKYGDWVGEELPQILRQTLRISTRREDTLIGGFSMGGYGAMRAAFDHPDVFAGA